MNTSNTLLRAALTSLVAMSAESFVSAALAADDHANDEQCAGVIKAGKNDPKWQRKSARLFLGIDHSAIVVADTEASLRYYRDTLGLRVAGTSENYGTEQEHLNNVFGARLRITALRAAAGPGVELLEYLAPRTGKPMPIDSLANYLWTWHINMTANVADADHAIGAGHYTYVSPGPVVLGATSNGSFVRDPDGHALLLQSR